MFIDLATPDSIEFFVEILFQIIFFGRGSKQGSTSGYLIL